jgi:beta-fructofuranosidase
MSPDEQFEALSGPGYPERLEDQLAALERDEQLARFRAERERLAADPFRPLYHFSPPENHLNDPNGLCRWRGRYHMFYQFWPGDSDRVHWGHAVSEDMVHWEDLPVAIYPTTERDCFSGQTVVEDDRVIAIYHGTQSGNAIATCGDPLLLNWEKHPNNPVIPMTRDGEPYRVFDPCIWREEDGYYALSGTYADGQRGVDCVSADHLFHSPDLAEWEYLGPLLKDPFWAEPGEDGAVPNFWPISDDKHMLLLFSHTRAGRYYVGEYDRETHRLLPDYHGRMNYGPISRGSLHAPSATIDDRGRYLAIFNTRGGRTSQARGIMTLPRHMWLDEDNSLRIAPLPEMQALRFDHTTVEPTEIPANEEIALAGVGGKAVEIAAALEPGSAREVGLKVLRSPDGAEETAVSLYRDTHGADTHSLSIDVSRASTRADVQARPPEVGPLHLPDGEPLRLRVFIDRSVVEVFANDRQCLTVRAFPEREDSTGLSVFARGGEAALRSCDVWQMRSIWPELRSREGA